ncbi:MAG: hypothetical protein RLY89_770 [Bacteroidota bacterium]|jgi:hypothetical protein
MEQSYREATNTSEKRFEQKLGYSIDKWNMRVAATTSIIALFAAFAGLLSTRESNLALINQIKAANRWSYFEAKTIKRDLKMMDSTNGYSRIEVEKIKKDLPAIKQSAEFHEQEAATHLSKLARLAAAVTLFQIGIAASAIAILTKNKILWYSSALITIIGITFLLSGIFNI